MRNPYQILGVSETASMDEVKKAYRKLSRIYHPDANVNNPNKDQAEAKFKEIQAAYQQIVDEKEHGGNRTSYGQGGYQQNNQGGYQQYYGGFEEFFGGFGGQYQNHQQSQESTLMQAAGNYLRNGYYREALNVLGNVPEAERNAKWYYYSAQANSGTGNNITAVEHAQRAVQMEPDNYVYQNLLRSLQSGETWYNERGTMYGRSGGGFNSLCCECLMFNLLCNCCC
jgi:molecular chaperone DnaJ